MIRDLCKRDLPSSSASDTEMLSRGALWQTASCSGKCKHHRIADLAARKHSRSRAASCKAVEAAGSPTNLQGFREVFQQRDLDK